MIAAGADPMALSRGIAKATEAVRTNPYYCEQQKLTRKTKKKSPKLRQLLGIMIRRLALFLQIRFP